MSARLKPLWLLAMGWIAATSLWAWVPIGGPLWSDGPVPIAMDLVRTAPSTSSGDWEGAALETFALWNTKLERVQLVPAPLSGEAWYLNGRNELFFDNNRFGNPFPFGVLAVSLATYDRDALVENDVVFNANVRWTVAHGNNRAEPWDFRRVLLHELGHLLGLHHPDESGQTVNSIMNSRVSDTEVLTADDVAGIRALYDFNTRVAPLIVEQPKGADVVQGAAVQLSVFAGGQGPLTYAWFRDGSVVPGATEASLSFTAELQDAGLYTASVRNAAGATASEPVRVAVRSAVAPAVTSVSPLWNVPAGTDVAMEAYLWRGDPPLHFEWRKNGVVVAGATRLKLMLSDVQFSDAGDYVLTARNGAGSTSTSAIRLAVTPPRPVRFDRGPEFRSTAPGEIFDLHVGPNRDLFATYQWQKDGVDLPGKNTATLQVDGTLGRTSGVYSVRLTNTFGSMTQAMAMVQEFARSAFTLTRQPAPASVAPGASASFTVETDASNPTYQWFKNGQPIDGAVERTFTVARVGYPDRGLYAVEVSQGSARVRSSAARLAIRSDPALHFILHPATHTVVAGGEVTLSGTAATGSTGELVTYQWFRNGAALPGRTENSLRFVANSAEAGRYVLRATAGGRILDSEEAEVVITPATGLFTAHPSSMLVPGFTQELRLNAVATEVALRRSGIAPSYLREGVPVSSPYISEEMLPGTYTQTLTRNGISETSRPFTLGYIPGARPEITRHPAGFSVWAGEPAILEVTAASGSPTTYRWYRDGNFVLESTSSQYRIAAFSHFNLGRYTVEVRNAAGSTWSEPAELSYHGLTCPVFRLEPSDLTLGSGSDWLGVETWRPGFRLQWFKDGRLLENETRTELSLGSGNASAGNYWVVATDGIVAATSRTARVSAFQEARAPTIVMAPVSQTVAAGGDVTLAVAIDGAPVPTQYQWRKDGRDIPGATDAKLKLHGVPGSAAGSYTVHVTNSAGSVTSSPVTVTVENEARLVNLATRAAVGRDGDILIAGFVIGGTKPRQVLVRGIGDQLSDFGVGGVLWDPVISLHNATGARIAENDDWFRLGEGEMTSLRNAARQAGAFALRDDAHDGALLATLSPGSYTAQVKGYDRTTGVALVEIYELGTPSRDRLVNLSSRALVGTGASILIPGLVLSGEMPRRLLIRAVGPGLADFGVAGALSDPTMTVFKGASIVATNDDWERQANAGELAPAMAGVGAFPLKRGSRDAVLLLDLAPGDYTVQVSGAGGTTGVALVEVYEIKR